LRFLCGVCAKGRRAKKYRKSGASGAASTDGESHNIYRPEIITPLKTAGFNIFWARRNPCPEVVFGV
jgi:hypothetical protein